MLMVIYHTAWDLDALGVARFALYDRSGWSVFRRFILMLFLGIMGASLTLASRGGLQQDAYLRRLAQIGGCAVLISLYSYLMFPARPIFFGVLHFILLSSVLGLAFLRVSLWPLLSIAAAVAGAGLLFADPAFNSPWLLWIGFTTWVPRSLDYVPMVPWFAVVLLGMAAGRALATGRGPAVMTRPVTRPPGRWLRFMGRHSLLIYMAHQPLLFGMLYGAVALAAPDRLAGAREPLLQLGEPLQESFSVNYMESCVDACTAETAPATIYGAGCRGSFAAGRLLAPADRESGRLSPVNRTKVEKLVKACIKDQISSQGANDRRRRPGGERTGGDERPDRGQGGA